MAAASEYPNLHRRESEADEQRLQAILFQAFAMVDTLHSQFQDYAVQPGTALAGDDAATPYDRLSSQVETCIGVAFDNLRTVRLILQDAETVPAFSHFGLIRNAIEAVGIGLWLVGPASRDERVLRSLQLSFENRKDLHGLEAAIEGTYAPLPLDDPTRLRLEELRDGRPAIRGVSLRPPTITDRLKGAQDFVDRDDFTILIVWKMTSGISHGQRSTMYALLDREGACPVCTLGTPISVGAIAGATARSVCPHCGAVYNVNRDGLGVVFTKLLSLAPKSQPDLVTSVNGPSRPRQIEMKCTGCSATVKYWLDGTRPTTTVVCLECDLSATVDANGSQLSQSQFDRRSVEALKPGRTGYIVVCPSCSQERACKIRLGSAFFGFCADDSLTLAVSISSIQN